MKAQIIVVFFMLFMWSCSSSIDGTMLLNAPTEEVKLTVENETFIVDFRFDVGCKQNMSNWDLPEAYAKLKTRNDLLNFYKTCKVPIERGPYHIPTSFGAMFPIIEYRLAQECFSDKYNSEFRKEVLQLAVNMHTRELDTDPMNSFYTIESCAKKSGVFLMAVILAKERKHTTNLIDRATLQQALLFLSNDEFVSEDFHKFIIECSEKFLTNSKN